MTQTLQQYIIEDLNVTPVINATNEYRTRVSTLKDTLKAKGHKGFTMSVTAEQSSVLAAHIAQQAVAELRRETGDLRYLFLALHLPEGQQDTKETNEVSHIIKTFINADEVIGHDITQSVSEKIANFPHLSNDKGQMQTRVRTAIAHGYAKPRNYMVVGSGNASENVLGESTRQGETEISDILPLSGLTRPQVNEMLHHLNAPAFLLANVPSVSKETMIDFASVDAYLGGAEVEAGEAQIIEQKFLTTEHTRRAKTPFFTKFDHYKIMNEAHVLAVA